MKVFLILTIGLLGTFTPLLSQIKTNPEPPPSEVTGKVTEILGQPFALANVLLLHATDSTVSKGTTSNENGVFVFEKIKTGTYLVVVSMVGYKKSYSAPFTITAENQWVKLATMVVATNTTQLGNATVIAKKPFIEQALDRTIVHVANSIFGSGGTALEVLEKSPGVTVDYQAESLQMRGKDGVMVQIDGKQSYLSGQDLIALLRSMPSANIDKIELITNPSAKYDAAGNSGIINIRLKSNNNIGTNGSLSVSAGTGRYDRERGSLQLNHRTKTWNLFGSYAIARGGNYFDITLDHYLNAPTTTNPNQQNFIYQYSPLVFDEMGQNAKLGFDYSLNKNTSIGLVWTGFWNKQDQNGTALSTFRHGETRAPYQTTNTIKSITNPSQNQIGSFNFQHSFGVKKGQLSVDIDLGHFTKHFINPLSSESFDAVSGTTTQSDLLSTMPTNINIYTFKADYNQPINAKWKMEAGIKSADVKTDNNLELSTGANGILKLDSTLSNHFMYTEHVNAAYISFVGKLNSKTDMQLGLRAEHTHSVSNSVTLKQELPRDYLNIFPTFFLSHAISQSKTLAFSYGYRLDRPNYQSINPGRSYIDPYIYTQGDPTLKPQFTHSLELKYGINKLYLSLAADFINDLMQSFNYDLTDKVTARIWQNCGNAQVFTLTAGFPMTVAKGWLLQTNVLAFYSQFNYTYINTPLQTNYLSARINLNNGFTFGKGWSAELNGFLNTPKMVNVIQTNPWMGSADVGIQKSVSAALKLKLSLQDVFHSNFGGGKVSLINNSVTVVRIYRDTRIALLTLNYAFGNQQLKASKQRKAASEEETKRAN